VLGRRNCGKSNQAELLLKASLLTCNNNSISRSVQKKKEGKPDWSILRRNCILRHVIEGDIESIGRRGRRRKRLVDGVKEKKIYRNLKAEALDGPWWRTRFRRGYGPVAKHTTE